MTQTSKKILLLSPVPLSRATDGVRVRGMALLSALSALGSVRVLSFDQDGELGDCPLPTSPGDWERLLSPVPSLVRCFGSARFRQLVERESRDCEICYCLGLQMFQYASAVSPGVPVVLDNFNVESDILVGLARRRSGLKRLYWRWQALKLGYYESRALTAANAVLAISRADQERFHQMAPGANVSLVGPGLKLDSLLNLRGTPVPGRIVFVGALGWHVNVEACGWFAREVLPRVRARLPGAVLQIVGRRPAEEVLGLQALPGVTVHPDVPEIAPYLEEASVVVVPLRYGSGVQNKVVEGLASGRALVTTSVGLEGLDLEPGRHLLVADSAEDMARSCCQLLANPQSAEQLGRAGRSLVADRYCLSRLCRDVRAFHCGLLGCVCK